MNTPEKYSKAVETIKTAILQGQYEAAKGVNRIQLAVYFAIGKYISLNTRKNKWGTGALETISQQLRKELPGLRGFSASSMKNMRLFYEEWMFLDPNSSVMPDELKSPIMIGDLQNANNQFVENSTIMIGELQDYNIDIYQAIQIPETKEFPVEDFFKVPFTHHIRIIEKEKSLHGRYYYIHRTAEENLQSRVLEKLIKEDAYSHQDLMPSNFAQTLPNSTIARKAVMMFKDEYLLDFINVEQIGERESIDVISFHLGCQGEKAPRKPIHRHCAMQIGQPRVCGVCDSGLQQAYGRGHLQNLRRIAGKTTKSLAGHGGIEEVAVRNYRQH